MLDIDIYRRLKIYQVPVAPSEDLSSEPVPANSVLISVN
jgi:hypothetical protein